MYLALSIASSIPGAIAEAAILMTSPLNGERRVMIWSEGVESKMPHIFR